VKGLKVLTAKEDTKTTGISAKNALRCIRDPRGPFNWAVIDSAGLDLHNAGYGGIDEMKGWLSPDKVLFGIIRFTFGGGAHGSGNPGGISGGVGTTSMAITKHVFVHWIGGKVSAVKRGQFNAKRGAAESLVRDNCANITFQKTAYDLDDVCTKDLIKELKRLSIVDGTACESNSISLEEYMKQLEQERWEHLEALADEELAKQKPEPLPDVQDAVADMRKGQDGGFNWLIIGAES